MDEKHRRLITERRLFYAANKNNTAKCCFCLSLASFYLDFWMQFAGKR